MRSRSVLPVLIAALLFSASARAGDVQKNTKNKFSMVKNADQWAPVRGLPEVVAEQPCDNWAMAASLEMLLAKQDVQLDQRFWVMKYTGGLACRSGLSYEDWSKTVEGEYTLAGGRTVRLTVNSTSALPSTTDALLLPIAKGRTYVLTWRGKAYVVAGMTWDELIYHTGQKLTMIKTITLIDPTESGDKRNVLYDRERDGTSELGGIFEVVAEDLNPNRWTPPPNPALP